MHHKQMAEIRLIMNQYLKKGVKPRKRLPANSVTGRPARAENYKQKQWKRLIAMIEEIQKNEANPVFEQIGRAQIIRHWKRLEKAGETRKTVTAKYQILKVFFSYLNTAKNLNVTVPMPKIMTTDDG